ncbi:MAG: flavodoxin family protein [Roseovarius sp.]
MRIVCLLGSPRADGNSDQLADAFLDAAETAGAEVSRHALRDLRFDGPTGKKPDAEGDYGVEDDMAGVLDDVIHADVIVFATPIYFCNMTGLMKQAFDRFFSFFVPDYVTSATPSRLGKAKGFVLIQTQGEGPERYGDLLEQYAPALDKLGLQSRALVRACNVRERGDVMQAKDAVQAAAEQGRKWASYDSVPSLNKVS